MKNKTLGFGKYKNKKLEQIAIIDPNYIFWLLENKIINLRVGVDKNINRKLDTKNES